MYAKFRVIMIYDLEFSNDNPNVQVFKIHCYGLKCLLKENINLCVASDLKAEDHINLREYFFVNHLDSKCSS